MQPHQYGGQNLPLPLGWNGVKVSEHNEMLEKLSFPNAMHCPIKEQEIT